jgi:hypothetical protein
MKIHLLNTQIGHDSNRYCYNPHLDIVFPPFAFAVEAEAEAGAAAAVLMDVHSVLVDLVAANIEEIAVIERYVGRNVGG